MKEGMSSSSVYTVPLPFITYAKVQPGDNYHKDTARTNTKTFDSRAQKRKGVVPAVCQWEGEKRKDYRFNIKALGMHSHFCRPPPG